MSIPGSANPLLFASVAAEAAGYQIERSIRLNSSDSAHLSRTPSSAGNRKTFTFSTWVKRCNLGSNQAIFTARVGTTGSRDSLRFESNDRLLFDINDLTQATVRTEAVFRDPSAWYHIVIAVDTTQSTAADRVSIYVNGDEVTDFNASSYPSQNLDCNFNSAQPHGIGLHIAAAQQYLDAYLADVHFIDGQALDPTDFGEYDDNNVWQPKEYTGSFGTNGFHLPFDDNSSAAALGTDSAGSNDWTVNNISVTAGAGNDSLVDSPTNGTQTDTGAGGEVVGNYATLNPLNKHTSSDTFSNGNLDFTTSSGGGLCESTIAMSSGKYYFEAVFSGGQGTAQLAGIRKPGARNYNDSYIYVGTGNKYTDGGSGTSYGATLSNGDVIGTAFDADNGTLTFYKNGVSQGTAFTGISGTYSFFVGSFGSPPTFVTNFGQRPFAYTAPSGFQAINTASLSDPTIADGSTAMDVALYTGNGSTQTISGLNFSPDLAWIKRRDSAGNHALFDQVRGAGKFLISSSTSAEGTDANSLTGFTSDGFSVGQSTTAPAVNGTSQTYVGWAWDAGSSTVTNTQGSITSSVRANASAGFSIVTWTGNGQSNATVGHGLGVAPSMIITVSRDGSSNWNIFHQSLATNNLLFFTTSAAVNVATSFGGGGIGPGTSTALNFTQGTSNVGNANANNVRYVAYVFSGVDGYSSFGSYTGNGSADGPFVYTGFRPRWIMVKSTSTTGWAILDARRNTYNLANSQLFPHASDAELTSPDYFYVDFLSNGFKLRTSNSASNTNAQSYIYACFGEHPLKTARAR